MRQLIVITTLSYKWNFAKIMFGKKCGLSGVSAISDDVVWISIIGKTKQQINALVFAS